MPDLLKALKTMHAKIMNIKGVQAQPEVKLSNREQEILELIMQEYNSEQMADMLFVSTHTIKSHRKNMMRKIGTTNVVGLVKYWYETKYRNHNSMYSTQPSISKYILTNH